MSDTRQCTRCGGPCGVKDSRKGTIPDMTPAIHPCAWLPVSIVAGALVWGVMLWRVWG